MSNYSNKLKKNVWVIKTYLTPELLDVGNRHREDILRVTRMQNRPIDYWGGPRGDKFLTLQKIRRGEFTKRIPQTK
jgi:hypothetical protein